MFFLTIIPIKKGLPLEELTYISKHDFSVGDIILCPFRSSFVHGLLVNKQSIQEAKSDIRRSPYEIKKIEKKESYSFLSPAEIKIFEKTAENYMISLAQVLSFFIPNFLFEQNSFFNQRKIEKEKTAEEKSFFIELPSPEKESQILSLIKETPGSLAIIHPTKEGVARLAKKYKGIKKVVVLSGSLSASLKNKRYKSLSEEKSLLFISTPSHALLLPSDTEKVIFDEWSSPYYYSHREPFFDTRYFLESFFRERSLTIYKSDVFILENTETKLFKNREVISDILDMSEKGLRFNDFLSTTLYTALSALKNSQGRGFLYASFLKNYSVTLCDDCGKILKDSCGGSLIQEEKEGKLFYSCTSCKKRIDLTEGQEVLCPTCGSFRLSLLNPGIGIIKKELEKMGFVCFDITSLETENALKKVCQEFYKTPGSILIGTSKALPYIEDKVSLSAILSLDTLFYGEDFLMDEKIFWLLSHIYNNTKNYFFIQTKFPTKKVL